MEELLLHTLIHLLTHTFLDTLKVLPFLYLMYLLMEFLEHKAGENIEEKIRSCGRFGPALGAVLGLVPQCGFSAMASGLYVARVITRGTLIAIFLATSDEMLLIMISQSVPASLILKVLFVKLLIGMMAGFLIDLFWKKQTHHPHEEIHHLCEKENCHCEGNLWLSALKHTLHIALFLFLITLGLDVAIHFLGEERLAATVLNLPVLGNGLAALVGLIPNCAASVVITELYLSGMISVGSMLSGLLAGSGLGMLMLFRVNEKKKDSALILALTVGIALIVGITIDLLPLETFFAL